MSLCSKPGCARPGSSVLGYDYGEQLIVLSDIADLNVSPHEYLLCAPCSERLRPPRGWSLDDQRASVRADREQREQAQPIEIRLVEAPSQTFQTG